MTTFTEIPSDFSSLTDKLVYQLTLGLGGDTGPFNNQSYDIVTPGHPLNLPANTIHSYKVISVDGSGLFSIGGLDGKPILNNVTFGNTVSGLLQTSIDITCTAGQIIVLTTKP